MTNTLKEYAAKIYAETPVLTYDEMHVTFDEKVAIFAMWISRTEMCPGLVETTNNIGAIEWSPAIHMRAADKRVRLNRVFFNDLIYASFDCVDDFITVCGSLPVPALVLERHMDEATKLLSQYTERALVKEKPVEAFIRVTRAGKQAYAGLELLNVSLVVDGLIKETVNAVSGQPGRQNFRTVSASKSGSMEPLHEGYWHIDEISWAGGKGNFSGSWSPGLGPLWVGISCPKSQRVAIGMHLDANRSYAPGTAGCVGMIDLDNLKKFASWFDRYTITRVTVNWGLGTVETQKKPAPAPQPMPAPTEPAKTGKRVCIEIGHGPYKDRDGTTGYEEGADGVGTTEYKQNLIRADIIARKLRAMGHDVTIVDSQDTLEDLGAKAAGHDCFVSLHLNSYDGKAQGTETLVHLHATPGDKQLAAMIQKRIVAALGLADRGVKEQDLGVLRGVPSGVKGACLTEAFFIDAIKTTEKIGALSENSAYAIVQGICDFLLATA